MIDFLAFRNRYLISGILELENPMHVGRGASLEPIGTDMPVIIDQQGRPLIPGSSVKGVLRSETERILRTLNIQQKKIDGKLLRACVSSDQCPNLSREERDELVRKCTKDGELDEEEFAEEIFSRLCTACELFGSGDSASHVMIQDMSLSSKRIRTELRDGVAIDRDTGTARSGALFDFEIVPAGAEFAFEAILENVEDWQVGLFGIVLKLWERGEIAIGGKTSIGMGFGKLKDLSVKVVNADNLIDHIISGVVQEETIDRYIQIFTSKLEGEHA
jgi:CRISPR-associated protein Csm3